MWMSKPNFLAYALLFLSALGIVLLLRTDHWHIQTRVKLGFVLMIMLVLALLACLPVMAMH